jgi:hypothetical protein
LGHEHGARDERRVAGANPERDGDRIEPSALGLREGPGSRDPDQKNADRAWLKYLESVSYVFHASLESG